MTVEILKSKPAKDAMYLEVKFVHDLENGWYEYVEQPEFNQKNPHAKVRSTESKLTIEKEAVRICRPIYYSGAPYYNPWKNQS